MMTPLERYHTDPYFRMLVTMFRIEFEKCDASGAGLTPTEVREASSFAWQQYAERTMKPSVFITKPEPDA